MIGAAVDVPRRRLPVAWRVLLTVTGTAVLLVATTSPLGAVNPLRVGGPVRPVAGGTPLGPNHPVLTFHDTLVNPTPLPLVSDPEPQVCTPRTFCDEWALTVGSRAPFLVSLRNAAPGFDANDGFNLAVYAPDGHPVGTSSGIGSDGQAVAVGADPGRGATSSPPVRGVYHVVVTLTYAYDNPLTYVGEARLLTSPSWTAPTCAATPPCDLLPRLTPLPPSDIHVDGLPPVPSTPLGFPFPVAAPTKNSCYADEKVQDGAKRCLRFTTDIQNTGAGMLELRWDFVDGSHAVPTSGLLPGGCEATQVVYRTDGTSSTRDAGPCEFHPQHAHFHYRDLVAFSLRPVLATGLGAPVAQSVKESFCLADDDYFGFGTAGPANGPREHPGMPGCDLPSRTDRTSATVDGIMGVSPGWGDVYSWDTPGQYLDISAVHDGEYAIVEQSNPDGRLLLDGSGPVCSATLVVLKGTTATMGAQEPSVTCP